MADVVKVSTLVAETSVSVELNEITWFSNATMYRLSFARIAMRRNVRCSIGCCASKVVLGLLSARKHTEETQDECSRFTSPLSFRLSLVTSLNRCVVLLARLFRPFSFVCAVVVAIGLSTSWL